jgi:hypothetical protein
MEESDPMEDVKHTYGLIVLVAGLFASSASKFLDHYGTFGTATDFTRGLFEGLSVVAFGVALFDLVRIRRITYTK